jgi:glucose uptake protein
MTWCVGATALFAVGGAEGAAAVGPSIAAGLTQGFPLVGLLWGLFVWKEFADAESNTRLLLAATVFLLVAGVGVIAVALGLGPL